MYTARTASLKAAGKSTFAYSDTTIRKSRQDWVVHETLDPKRVNNNGPFKDKITRESADSTEHPTTVPVVVFFDVTGSMRHVPAILQDNLPKLLGNLQQVNGVDHPSILFGAIGDVRSDRVPLQVSQFESDNTMDTHLSNIFLEGNGGGGDVCESYDMGFYFLARHTHIDAFEKRGQKGYAFFIGDEHPRSSVLSGPVNDIIGDGLQGDVALADIIAEVQTKWEVFFIIPKNASHGADAEIRKTWEDLLGKDYVLSLPTEADIADVIGTEVGLREAKKGVVSLAAKPTPAPRP